MPIVAMESAVTPLVLALDVGTSSVRSLLFDRHGDAVEATEEQLPFDLTTTLDGGAFVDADFLVDLVGRCIDVTVARSASRLKDVAAVGISCFWHSLLGLDRQGAPAIPVLLWADKRSAREVDELRASVDRALMRALTGCVIHSSYWPAKLRWLQREEPDAVSRTARWCAFSDYLLQRITGSDFTSVSMASGTGLLDIQNAIWSPEAAEISGISLESLARIGEDGEHSVGLTGEWAARWPALIDVPWFPALGDGACANAGTGAFTSDRIALSLGTSGAMRIAVDSHSGASFEIPDDLWAYRLDHQRVVFGAAISNGGKVLAWLAELLGVDFEGPEIASISDLEPDCHGLTLLPFLAGERAPIWNDRATAVIAGLTLSTGKVELLQAGMEAVSLRFARLYEGLRRVASSNHEIVANGAAILKSVAWLQMTADSLNHSLTALPAEEESSARGAAVMALLHGGLIGDVSDVRDPAKGARLIWPVPENAKSYSSALTRQRTLEHLLFPEGTSWDAGSTR